MKKFTLGCVLGVLLGAVPIHADDTVKVMDRAERLLKVDSSLIEEFTEFYVTVCTVNPADAQVSSVCLEHNSKIDVLFKKIIAIGKEK
jgi:hypothetical protein